MSDALFETDFSKMNHKQLCEKVEELYAIVAKFKRLYNWQMENIDSSNLGKELSLQNKNMKANISITAEKLESVYEKTEENTENMSRFTQTAEKIETEVKATTNRLFGEVVKTDSLPSNPTDEQKSKIYNVDNKYYYWDGSGWKETSGTTIDQSLITQKANEITASVEKVEGDLTALANVAITADKVKTEVSSQMDGKLQGYATQTWTSEQISTEVAKISVDGIDFSKAVLGATVTATEKNVDTNSWDVKKLYYVLDGNNRWYFKYNTSINKWEQINSDSVKSRFTQTGSGFEFDGAIKIGTDLIADGAITGSKLSSTDLYVDRIRRKAELDPHWFGLMDYASGEEARIFGIAYMSGGDYDTFDDALFGFKTTVNSTNSNMVLNGKEVIGYETGANQTIPKGKWEFKYCDAVNLKRISGTADATGTYSLWQNFDDSNGKVGVIFSTGDEETRPTSFSNGNSLFGLSYQHQAKNGVTAGGINLVMLGNDVIGYTPQNVVLPKGVWDFQNVNEIKNLGVRFT